jgi:hypothetical protein
VSDLPPPLLPPSGEPSRTAHGPAPDLDLLARDLVDVDVALRRLDEGTYGTCETCGTDLDADAVVAFPAARRCPRHGGPVGPPAAL